MEGMQANPAQIKKYLKQLSKSREQYLGYLGQLAYQEYQEGNLPVAKLQEVCATLDGIAAQVSKCEQDLAMIEQMKMVAKYPRCVYCGDPVPPGSPNCTTCGQPVGHPPRRPRVTRRPPPRDTLRFRPPRPPRPPRRRRVGKACVSCGAPLQADATFCTGCGQPVARPSVAPQRRLRPRRPPPHAAPPAEAPAARGGTAAAAAAPDPARVGGTARGGIRRPLTCSSCGTVYDDPEALFCTECGNKMR